MGELISRILALLEAAGLPAEERLPSHPYRRVTDARANVQLRKLKSVGSGLGNYLGLSETEDGGTVERYGKKMTAEIRIRVLAADASAASEAASTVWETAEAGIPGVSVTGIELSEGSFDAQSDCFVQDVTVSVLASLWAERTNNDTEFLNFHLEGEMQ